MHHYQILKLILSSTYLNSIIVWKHLIFFLFLNFYYIVLKRLFMSVLPTWKRWKAYLTRVTMRLTRVTMEKSNQSSSLLMQMCYGRLPCHWNLPMCILYHWRVSNLKKTASGMQTTPNATKRVRIAAAYTVAAQAVLSETNIGTTQQDHYDAFKVYMNWKHVRQKRAATIIQRFYRRRRLREEFKLINVSRHQITGKITLVYDDRY